MRDLGHFLRAAWRLAWPYFWSEERWAARLLLASIVALNLLLVGMNVVLNFWNGAFYDSLQNKEWDAFISLLLFGRLSEGGFFGFMPGFTLIAAIYIPVAIYRTYLNQWLQIRWRRWMTARLTERWLSDRAYYRIGLLGDPTGLGTDNPDQRIADDTRVFISDTLSLSLGLLSNIVSLFSFVSILWTLSGAVTLLGVTIPGYMVWAALLYAIVGTWLTHLVGRPLAMLNFQQERVEADFRYSLVRLRENAEGVALYGGEAEEQRTLGQRFMALADNWWRIMQRTKMLNSLIAGYEQVATIFPFVVAAPRYFAGEIQLGGLMRTASAFGRVQDSLSWFITAYASLASWRATVTRLDSFETAILAARALADKGATVQTGEPGPIRLEDVTLQLPDGSRLIEHARLTFPPGESTVVAGRSGSGKSTLFRALAGIWPFGSGHIVRPPGTYLFLPQRPYIPLGTLRHAVTYPAPHDAYGDEAIARALQDAGLGAFAGRLDEEQNWSQRLSGGEQQRLAIARALLLRPDWLFLDEATASLDPEGEADIYRTLRARLPDTTLISIAHRPAVAGFHDRWLVFRRPPGAPGSLEEQAVKAAE